MKKTKKEVDILIGVPCSGKSTYSDNNYSDDVFIISRDNIRHELIRKTAFKYSDFFVKPSQGDEEHHLYGFVTDDDNWSNIKYLNRELKERFDRSISQAVSKLDHGKRVAVDLTNLTRKERDDIKSWFKEVEDVKFNAIIFDFKENLDLIKEQNKKRGMSEDKFIPNFVIDKMVESFEDISLDENFTEISFVDGLKGLKEDQKLTNTRKRRKLR